MNLGINPNLEEQQLLRMSMSAIGAIAWQWNLDSGVFSYSQSQAEALGLDCENSAFSLFDRISYQEQTSLMDSAEQAHTGREAFEQLVHVQINADYHPFRIIGSRIDMTEPGPRSMAGILLAGADTGFLLDSILNNTTVLVYVKDLHGHYLFANREYARHCQVEQYDMLGKTDADLFSLSFAQTVYRFEQWVIQTAKNVEIEEKLPFGHDKKTYLSGRFPIQNSQGAAYALGGVLTDISQLKDFEKTVEMQRQELRMVLDALPSQVWYLNDQGCVKAINQKVADELNVDLRAIKDRVIADVIYPEQYACKLQRQVEQVLKTGEPVLGATEQQVLIGKRLWSRVDCIPMLDDQDGSPGALLVISDITELKHNEEVLARNDARYRSFIANSHDGIFNLEFLRPILTNTTREKQIEHILLGAYVTECNDVFAQQCGRLHARDCTGIRITDLSDKDFFRQLVTAFVENHYQLANFERKVAFRNQQSFWASASLEGVIENNMLISCWGSLRDTTERQQYLEELEYQANHDSLTQLPNRKKLYVDSEQLIQSLYPGTNLALMLIDLDRFKEINDTLGHHIGDRLLKQIGPRLEMAISRYQGLVARLGGDEFAVVLANIQEHEAILLAGKILDKISDTFDLQDFRADISASVGIAMCPRHADDIGTLMRYADVAMYRAKTESLGVLQYAPEFDKHTHKRLALMTDLGRAIKTSQLYLLFQPKIDINGEFVHSFEALLRWRHPVHGIIPPSEFVPLAENTELIRPLTLWVLNAALAQCRHWNSENLNIKVSVNLSARNLLDDKIVKQVASSLAHHGISPGTLELEITESAIMADPKRALLTLQKLHALGVHLAIDDFGTGYSSLAYLKRLPVESLKIDYSFVIDMLNDEHDEIIVRSTINLAHNLGLIVVAEGVESPAILEKLFEMGCDQAQGYFIGRPMDSDEVTRWLSTMNWSTRRVTPQ